MLPETKVLILLQVAQKGEGRQKDKAKTNLIKHVDKMILKVAHRYRDMNVSLDDLVQAGREGALIAISRYNIPSDTERVRVAKFSSYAFFWVRLHMIKIVKKYNKHMSGTRKWIRCDSLDAGYPTENNDGALTKCHTLAAPQESEVVAEVQSSLLTLSETQRALVVSRFGLSGQKMHTWVEMSKKYNLSRPTLIRRVNKALAVLKEQLAVS